MDRPRRHGDLNGVRNADRQAGSRGERSRPRQHPAVPASGLRASRSTPVASTNVRPSRSERLRWREEAERRRRDRVIGHTILGAAALSVFLAMLLVIGSLGIFVIAVVALFVGLRSLTFAMSIGLDDAWGWTRDGGMSVPLRWSDHVVLGGLRWLRRRSSAAVDVPASSPVRVLPPEPLR